MAIERVNPIRFEYDGESYELFFTRRTVRQMELDGFRTENLKDQTINTVLDLFAGAFQAKHKFVKRDKIEKIYDALRKKGTSKNEDGETETLIERLLKLYREPYEVLLEDKDDENLIEWN